MLVNPYLLVDHLLLLSKIANIDANFSSNFMMLLIMIQAFSYMETTDFEMISTIIIQLGFLSGKRHLLQ